MRASTVFAIALSLLIALGAAAGAKYAGLFDKKAPPPADRPPPIRVLVATVNLYEEVTVLGDQVRVRDIRPEEQAELERRFGGEWKSKLMPALVTAAHLRTPKRNIPADSILLRDYFDDPNLPTALPDRLERNTRAVNVSVTKDMAAGGAIRRGEYVDVLFTTKVWDNSTEKEELRTAILAKACKVIMKRNNPWDVMAADPDNKPLNFTLQANAYRAALIEYARNYGQISLQPVPRPEKSSGSFSDPNSEEYAHEDQRVEDILRGELTIGSKDLERLFRLPPPTPKPPPPQPRVIEHYAGVAPAGKTVFYPQVSAAARGAAAPADTQPKSPEVQPAGGTQTAPPSGDSSGNYNFRMPSATGKDGCKGCDEKKKKALEAQRPAVGK